jgi:hypothetical protein
MNKRQKKKRLKMRYKNGYSPKVKIFTMDESIFDTYHKDLTIPDVDYPIANPVKIVTLGEFEEEFHPTVITEALKSADEMWRALAEEYYDKELPDE